MSKCVWLLLLLNTQVWRVARKRVHCENNTSFVTWSWACVSIAFLAGVTSIAVDFCHVITSHGLNNESRWSAQLYAASQRCTRDGISGVLFRLVVLTVVYTDKWKLKPKNTIIDKTLTYASETWILTKGDRKQINISFKESIWKNFRSSLWQ